MMIAARKCPTAAHELRVPRARPIEIKRKRGDPAAYHWLWLKKAQSLFVGIGYKGSLRGTGASPNTMPTPTSPPLSDISGSDSVRGAPGRQNGADGDIGVGVGRVVFSSDVGL